MFSPLYLIHKIISERETPKRITMAAITLAKYRETSLILKASETILVV